MCDDGLEENFPPNFAYNYGNEHMKHAIGIDIGTSKICVLLFALDAFKTLAIKSVPNTSTRAVLPNTHHEQDPEVIWGLVASLFDEMREHFGSVELIAITGQMHGVMLLNTDNKPVTNFFTWRDTRYAVIDDSDAFAATNGCTIHVGYGANTVLGLLKESNLDVSGCKVCSITSYIMGSLCQDDLMVETMAASFGVFDIINHRWNHEQLESLGLHSHLFSEVAPSGIPIATVSPSLSKRFNLAENVQVFSPIGDNQASIIGAIGFSHLGVINIGTSGQFSIPTTHFAYSNSIEVRPLPGYGYLQVYSSLCGGWSYAYLKDFCKDMLAQFGCRLSDKQIFDRLDALIVKQMHSEGLQVDTLFLGTRENPEKLGAIRTIDTKNFTITNLAYGFIQGILQELHHPAITLDAIPFLVASGNAVRKSPFMKQAIEQEFGCPCKYPPFLEEATIGAILLGYSYHYGKEKVDAFFKKFYQSC